MRAELDKRLCEEFPNLYRNRNRSMMETCMCWGFDCDDGWYNLIYNLSAQLEAEIMMMPEEHRPTFCAAQVKEKYGTLRFYMEGCTDTMGKFIREAENKSEETCEVCGAPGELHPGGWWYTSCKEHERK